MIVRIPWFVPPCFLIPAETNQVCTTVRKRNYENFTANIAYQPEGNVVLDQKEMLDEWGRENDCPHPVVCPTMLPDTCRNESSLYDDGFPPEIPVPTHPTFLSDRVPRWDKPRDADNHYELFPLSQTQLEQNEYLKQNPGYPDIAR